MKSAFEWNKIYDIDEFNYATQLMENRKYYRQLEKSKYETIHDCVDHAIEEGNHAAFAHFFLMEERSKNRVFGKVLSQVLNEREKVENFNRQMCWIQAPIIQQNYWRAIDFKFTSESIFKRITENKKKTIVYDMDLDNGKESQQRRNWRTGKAIPPRDVIVQIAISLGISIEETNQLLRAACEPALYVLDVVDVCSMFTLREFENNYSICPFEKLKMTKDQINESLRECLNNKMTTVPFSRVHFLGSREPLGAEIDKEINEIIKTLGGEKSQSNDSGVSLTMYLTRLFEDRFNKSKDMSSYVGKNHIAFGDAQSPYMVFLQKYYGFLHKTKLFLEQIERYEKNLKYSGWPLRADGLNSIDYMLYQSSAEHSNKHNNTTMAEGLQIVDKIWHIADLIGSDGREYQDGDDWIDFKPLQGALTIPRQMIEGRKISSSSIDTVYEMNFGNKVHLMKFAIATGNEDEAGKYLQLAGVWERDWYEVFKNRADIQVILDRSDYLLIYALLVRDRLIEKWNTRNSPIYASGIRSAFPMIKLLLTINRDIALASMKLYDEKGRERDYDKGFAKHYEDDLVRLQTEMVYPIAWYYLRKNVRNKSLNLYLSKNYRDKNSVGLWRWKVDN